MQRKTKTLYYYRPILISSWFTPFAYHLIKVPVGLFALTITPSAFHSIRKTHPFHKSLFFLVPFGLPSRILAPTVLTEQGIVLVSFKLIHFFSYVC